LNTPYPSTAYLTGFLRSRGFDAVQEDLALELVLKLFSSEGLRTIRTQAEAIPAAKRPEQTRHFLAHVEQYLSTIDRVIAWLQGRDSTLAHRIVTRQFLPEGARFRALDVYVSDDSDDSDGDDQDGDGGDPLSWAFGMLGTQDRARHFATLYL
ncbi:MAG: radical SAM protein, partial [Phycisphaerae bacterium]